MTELDRAVRDLLRATIAEEVYVMVDDQIAAYAGSSPAGFSVASTIEAAAQRFGELEGSEPEIHEALERNRMVHASRIGRRSLLLVVFGPTSSLGLVRLRVKQALGTFRRILGNDDEPEQSVGAVRPRT